MLPSLPGVFPKREAYNIKSRAICQRKFLRFQKSFAAVGGQLTLHSPPERVPLSPLPLPLGEVALGPQAQSRRGRRCLAGNAPSFSVEQPHTPASPSQSSPFGRIQLPQRGSQGSRGLTHVARRGRSPFTPSRAGRGPSRCASRRSHIGTGCPDSESPCPCAPGPPC